MQKNTITVDVMELIRQLLEENGFIPAITLWQPWASLLACGAKLYETRSWATSYRGPIAIHAALKHPYHCIGNLVGETTDAMIRALNGTAIKDLPLGKVVATAELVGCHEMVLHGGRGISSTDPGWLETENGIYYPTEQELAFGDWTPGRFAWEFKNMTMLPEPIPARGGQRIWKWRQSA